MTPELAVGKRAARTYPVRLGARTVELLGPADPEALLDEISPTEFARDERMPYWAELWPSARVLATMLVEGEGAALVRGRRVLELGAGLGLPSLAAVVAGASEVVATDYADEGLAFLQATAARAGLSERLRTRPLDWREPPVEAPFEVGLAADVCYEARLLEPLLACAHRMLARGAVLVLADPGRAAAAGLEDEAVRQGFVVRRATTVADGKARVTIRVLERA